MGKSVKFKGLGYEGRRTIIDSALNWEDKQRKLFNMKRDQWKKDREEGKVYPISHYITLARQEIDNYIPDDVVKLEYSKD